MTTQDLVIAFSISQNQLKHFLSDITSEMAGQKVEGGGNPVNWILGHILTERVEAIELTGNLTIDIPDLSMYATGTKPGQYPAISYDELKTLISTSFEQLLEAFKSMQDEGLAVQQPGTMVGKNYTLGQQLFTYSLHEMYHIGQISIARKQYGVS